MQTLQPVIVHEHHLQAVRNVHGAYVWMLTYPATAEAFICTSSDLETPTYLSQSFGHSVPTLVRSDIFALGRVLVA